MKRAYAVGTCFVLSAALAGCAVSASRQAAAVHRCSDAPKKAVVTFFEGLAEQSLRLLRSVIQPGMYVLAVFGDGDWERGQEVVRQLIRHPEALDDKDFAGAPQLTLLHMEPGADGEQNVTVRREDTIYHRDNDAEIVKMYERAFAVRFTPDGNCITAVRPLGSRWDPVSDRP